MSRPFSMLLYGRMTAYTTWGSSKLKDVLRSEIVEWLKEHNIKYECYIDQVQWVPPKVKGYNFHQVDLKFDRPFIAFTCDEDLLIFKMKWV